jgi:hypothetical protein
MDSENKGYVPDQAAEQAQDAVNDAEAKEGAVVPEFELDQPVRISMSVKNGPNKNLARFAGSPAIIDSIYPDKIKVLYTGFGGPAGPFECQPSDLEEISLEEYKKIGGNI